MQGKKPRRRKPSKNGKGEYLSKRKGKPAVKPAPKPTPKRSTKPKGVKHVQTHKAKRPIGSKKNLAKKPRSKAVAKPKSKPLPPRKVKPAGKVKRKPARKPTPAVPLKKKVTVKRPVKSVAKPRKRPHAKPATKPKRKPPAKPPVKRTRKERERLDARNKAARIARAVKRAREDARELGATYIGESSSGAANYTYFHYELGDVDATAIQAAIDAELIDGIPKLVFATIEYSDGKGRRGFRSIVKKPIMWRNGATIAKKLEEMAAGYGVEIYGVVLSFTVPRKKP